MQNAPLYAASNQMQRRDAGLVLASHLPRMDWSQAEDQVSCDWSRARQYSALIGRQRILDVGCGSGDVTSSLLVPAVRGVQGARLGTVQGVDREAHC